MVFKTRVVSQSGYGKNYSFQKVPYIIKVALKLATINGYDDQYRIRNRNGKYLVNTNVHDLLNHCMSVGRKLTAENEFIELLAEADIDPDWILNENVKAKLIPLVGYKNKPAQYRPHPSQTASKSVRTFTELPPPHDIINVPTVDDNERDEEEEELDMQAVGDLSDNVEEENESIDEVVETVKRKRPTTRALSSRKRRVADENIEDLMFEEIDLPKVRSNKRPRWEQPV